MRHDGRRPDQLRSLTFQRRYTGMAPGSVLVRMGRTAVLCTCSVEIQRLIGRALRTVVDLGKLGERTLWIDCDVLEADGGTRTASINGAFVALVDALRNIAVRPVLPPLTPLPPLHDILRDSVAAVSVGLYEGQELLDLDYREDRDADVDLNLVMTGAGDIIEVQAGGEEATFRRDQLDRLLELGRLGIDAITRAQRGALGADWPEPGI